MLTTKTTFFTLPREIRDEIYDLAYIAGGDEDIQITSLADWYRRAREKRAKYTGERIWRDNSRYATPLPPLLPLSDLIPPTCPLLPMLVNKQFYQEAMETYFRCKTVYSRYSEYDTQDPSEDCPLLKAYLTKLDTFWKFDSIGRVERVEGRPRRACMAFENMDDWVAIRELRLEVEEAVFTAFPTRFACCDTYTDKDFEMLDGVY